MSEHSENIDPDILKGREDILRAQRAEAAGRHSNDADTDLSSTQSHTTDDSKKRPPQPIPRQPSPVMKAVVNANRQKLAERGKSDIPVFNVSEKILVRQRQSASAKRTAPLKRHPAETSEPVHFQAQPNRIEYSRPDHNSLVTEIVARDIYRLCQG